MKISEIRGQKSEVRGLFSVLCSLLSVFCLLFSVFCPLSSAWAQETDAMGFARGELLMRQKKYEDALREFGQISKGFQEDPVFQRRVEQALAALYRPQALRSVTLPPPVRFIQQLRVVRRQQDATRNADQSGNNRGLQVNESFSGLRENPDGISTRFQIDVDGFKNGHNDLRYRTLLADLFEGRSHLGVGDSATYPSPYFLRGSRLRGLNWIMKGPENELQLVAGAYPVWLESRDEYVYPRSVWGVRDKVKLAADRVRLGAGVTQTRDSEKIRTEDGANPQARVDPVFQPRDNTVFMLDQEFKILEDVWTLKASESYSYTDDNLIESRFGETTKLKDFAFQAETQLIQPLFFWKASYDRTGPDYRLLTDLPQGSPQSVKDIQADRERIVHFLDLKPLGPFDADFEASFMRNDLDDDDTVEHTRQSWYTANLGIETPPFWPRPKFRGTYFETISVPGSATRPSQTRTYEITGELQKHLFQTDWSAFTTYEIEHPVKDKLSFDEEDRLSVGIRGARPIGERLLMNCRYKYLAFDELFDESRQRGILHEANFGGSLRLWSTANLSANYTYTRGQLSHPGSTRLAHGEGHAGTFGFTWPYQRFSPDKRRKWNVLPGITYHINDITRDLENRTLLTGRLSMAYEVYRQWRLELLGEYRYDDDDETDQLKTKGLRAWLLWTSRFGG